MEMINNTILLGNYFDNFIKTQVLSGQYKDESDVIIAGLLLLENEQKKIIALKQAIHEGVNSPAVENFDFDSFLINIKSERS